MSAAVLSRSLRLRFVDRHGRDKLKIRPHPEGFAIWLVEPQLAYGLSQTFTSREDAEIFLAGLLRNERLFFDSQHAGRERLEIRPRGEHFAIYYVRGIPDRLIGHPIPTEEGARAMRAVLEGYRRPHGRARRTSRIRARQSSKIRARQAHRQSALSQR